MSQPQPSETPETRTVGPLLEDYLTRKQLASEFGISADTLARWATDGTGPPHVRIGKKAMYRRQAVLDWLKAREETRS